MFWVLELVFFKAAGGGGVAVGDEADALAIVAESMQLTKRDRMLYIISVQDMRV